MEEFGSSSLYDTSYNPKNWSERWINLEMDKNDLPLESNSTDPMLGVVEPDFRLIEKPLEWTAVDCLVPLDIKQEMPELFSLDLEREFQIVGDINFEVSGEQHCQQDEGLNDMIANDEFLVDDFDERKFGPESMRIVNPRDVYFPEPPEINLVTIDWRDVLKDHDYCLEENCDDEPIPMDIIKNEEPENNVDVWGSSSDDSSSTGECSKFVKQPNLATSFKEDINNTGLHREVAGVNKLPRAKGFSRVSNSTRSMMKDLRVALKTRSGSRRSARNIRPKGSVETTPSGSDFEDGWHAYMKPPQKRMRGSTCSVNRTSNRSLSEFNFEDGSHWYPKKKLTKQKRSACRSTNFLPPFQLDSEGESHWYSKERPIKRMRTTSQSVGRTSNQTNRRTVGRNVPKSTKKKTLKEKQGHKDNEKLRRDKLRDAFINLREEIPLHCLIRETDKPSVMISKQKILNGAVTRIKGISEYKQKLAEKIASCAEKAQFCLMDL
ncbi:BHLH domain-containing protein [Trichonephila inaurata madagascariensis]|uniref:BHLH domain-containing protein n=1 Tax=Trichonephila inaurata madagascariensis TaxID=2747483 RepID=A0A8X6IXA8_9ARAC|nr:BHLH domain-containing protein [Trichonephila inaurata madagascariensis]